MTLKDVPHLLADISTVRDSKKFRALVETTSRRMKTFRTIADSEKFMNDRTKYFGELQEFMKPLLVHIMFAEHMGGRARSPFSVEYMHMYGLEDLSGHTRHRKPAEYHECIEGYVTDYFAERTRLGNIVRHLKGSNKLIGRIILTTLDASMRRLYKRRSTNNMERLGAMYEISIRSRVKIYDIKNVLIGHISRWVLGGSSTKINDIQDN